MPITACSKVGLRLSSESNLSLRRPPSSVSANEGSKASFAASCLRDAATTWRSDAATSGRLATSDDGSPARTGGGTGTKSPRASTSAAG